MTTNTVKHTPDTREWQPVETAPRDGSMILIAVKRVYPSVHPARWRGTDADAISFRHWDSWQHWFSDADLIGWMPLPPAPQEKGRG